jgi:hypothetical protein
MLIDINIAIMKFLSNVGHTILIQRFKLFKHVGFTVRWRWNIGWLRNNVHSSIRVLLEVGLVSTHVDSPSETTIKGCLIQD